MTIGFSRNIDLKNMFKDKISVYVKFGKVYYNKVTLLKHVIGLSRKM